MRCLAAISAAQLPSRFDKSAAVWLFTFENVGANLGPVFLEASMACDVFDIFELLAGSNPLLWQLWCGGHCSTGWEQVLISPCSFLTTSLPCSPSLPADFYTQIPARWKLPVSTSQEIPSIPITMPFHPSSRQLFPRDIKTQITPK